jgi:hypothetical protein
MFTPPICRRSRRNPARELTIRNSRFVGSDEDGGSLANIAASGSERSDTASPASEAIKHRELEERGIAREVTGWMSHYCDLHLQPTCGAG